MASSCTKFCNAPKRSGIGQRASVTVGRQAKSFGQTKTAIPAGGRTKSFAQNQPRACCVPHSNARFVVACTPGG